MHDLAAQVDGPRREELQDECAAQLGEVRVDRARSPTELGCQLGDVELLGRARSEEPEQTGDLSHTFEIGDLVDDSCHARGGVRVEPRPPPPRGAADCLGKASPHDQIRELVAPNSPTLDDRFGGTLDHVEHACHTGATALTDDPVSRSMTVLQSSSSG